MTRRTETYAASSCYDDMPLSIVLFRFLWPFWLFRNASSGDRFARAAAYRHNRSMRVYLPGYLMKWMLGSGVILALTSGCETLARSFGPTPNIVTLVAVACALAFTCSVCVLCVTAYIYFYLSRHDT